MANNNETEATVEFSRLPKTIIPRHYDLHLTIDLDAASFSGTCSTSIEYNSTEPLSSVLLNAVDLQIQSARVDGIEASEIKLDAKRETAEFLFKDPINGTNKTNGVLVTCFTGVLNDKMKGFYRSTYTRNGIKKYMATTQFEATDARRALPCWDEPAIKATFQVQLTVPAKEDYEFTVVSNTPCCEEQFNNQDKSTSYKFEKTPIMSTYLLAFVVGEFDFVEKNTAAGQRIRVFTPKGKKEEGEFALDVAVKALPFYEKFFGIDYPLKKCDLLAIPDFAAGAMENWGCITYRETALLVSPTNSSASAKQWVAIVVCHELAHQWFGNLVTMEWWTHLWLNEGFASFCEIMATHHIFPEWKIWEQFVAKEVAEAFKLDALKNSHPVEVQVNSPDEVDEIFDTVSYCKGSAIIRMLEDAVGHQSFSKGLNLYLNKHVYKNTFTEDLWDALKQTSSIAVDKMMNSFTKQTGYPVVFVKRNNEQLEFEQYRFLKSGIDKKDPTLWVIPLRVQAVGAEDPQLVQLQGERTFSVKSPGNGPILVNPGRTGFFRVGYDSQLLFELKKPLSELKLHPIDRLSIQTDSFALAQCGMLKTADVLELFESYANETEYTVWTDLLSNLGALNSLLAHQQYAPTYAAWGIKLVQSIAAKLGWDAKPNEGHLDALLRTLVLTRLVAFKDGPTITEARKRFEAFLKDHNSLSPNLRTLVYRAVVSMGDSKDLDTLIELHRKFEMHEEKERVMRVLGWASSQESLKRVLEFSLSEEVRSQDSVFCLETVAFNPKGTELAWKFLQANWAKISATYEGGFLLSRLVGSVCSSFTNRTKIQEITAFFEKNPAPAAARTIQQAIETISGNCDWLERDGAAIEKYLTSKN